MSPPSMAKKRKLVTKSTPSTTTPTTKPQQTPQKKNKKPSIIEQDPPIEQPESEQESSDEEIEDSDDDEPLSKLLEPFTKEQLTTLLIEAAESNSDVLARVKKLADVDPVHRKIFVHGLGWDATYNTLQTVFSEYGEIEDCKAVMDKVSGKCKGYGFILFKSRVGAYKALKEPQKKIGNRITHCQLAIMGPAPAVGQAAVGVASGSGLGQVETIVNDYLQRKIYVSNVGPELDPQKVRNFFSKYGEIEEGPMGLNKKTGKFKGFCLFVYKTAEGARKALEESHKNFEGHILHCQRALDGPKGKPQQSQSQGGGGGGYIQSQNVGGVGQHFGLGKDSGNSSISSISNHVGLSGGVSGLMGQSSAVPPFNHGGGVGVGQGYNPALGQGYNPALGQALTALLATQGTGMGLSNLFGSIGGGAGGVAGAGAGVGQVGYGTQGLGVSGINPIGGYAAQGGLQSSYPSQQTGLGGSGRSQLGGYMGGLGPYGGQH